MSPNPEPQRWCVPVHEAVYWQGSGASVADRTIHENMHPWGLGYPARQVRRTQELSRGQGFGSGPITGVLLQILGEFSRVNQVRRDQRNPLRQSTQSERHGQHQQQKTVTTGGTASTTQSPPAPSPALLPSKALPPPLPLPPRPPPPLPPPRNTTK